MEVNVELWSTEKSRIFRTLKAIAISFLAIALIAMAILLIWGNTLTLIVIMFGFYILASILGTSLSFSNGGIKSIGKLTFAKDGLTIHKDNKSTHFKLTDLTSLKIAIKDYSGEPNAPTAIITPSKKGTENFLWLDSTNKKDRLRFKLISKNHMNRLIDTIEKWQQKTPSIKIK